MKFDFNTSLYGSDGSSVLSGNQASAVQKSDDSLMNNFLSLIGAGASAYATVTAAQAAKKSNSSDNVSPGKTAAPVIGTPTAPALTDRAKALIGGAVGLVVLIVVVLLFRRK
jgi:hypothetical protein